MANWDHKFEHVRDPSLGNGSHLTAVPCTKILWRVGSTATRPVATCMLAPGSDLHPGTAVQGRDGDLQGKESKDGAVQGKESKDGAAQGRGGAVQGRGSAVQSKDVGGTNNNSCTKQCNVQCNRRCNRQCKQ